MLMLSSEKAVQEGTGEIFSFVINGLPVQTGDLMCVSSGRGEILVGEFWRILGRLVPGDVDHIAIYLGPEGTCIEAGPNGVHLFDTPGPVWDAEKMMPQRGTYLDTLVGVAYPLAGRGFTPEDELKIRIQVRQFCLEQARLKRKYNFNIFNPDTDEAFYCSQLPYRAYLPYGINLNTGLGVPNLPGSEHIVFPQEIWDGCVHRVVEETPGSTCEV
jgi:hypothetical protein